MLTEIIATGIGVTLGVHALASTTSLHPAPAADATGDHPDALDIINGRLAAAEAALATAMTELNHARAHLDAMANTSLGGDR